MLIYISILITEQMTEWEREREGGERALFNKEENFWQTLILTNVCLLFQEKSPYHHHHHHHLPQWAKGEGYPVANDTKSALNTLPALSLKVCQRLHFGRWPHKEHNNGPQCFPSADGRKKKKKTATAARAVCGLPQQHNCYSHLFDLLHIYIPVT